MATRRSRTHLYAGDRENFPRATRPCNKDLYTHRCWGGAQKTFEGSRSGFPGMKDPVQRILQKLARSNPQRVLLLFQICAPGFENAVGTLRIPDNVVDRKFLFKEIRAPRAIDIFSASSDSLTGLPTHGACYSPLKSVPANRDRGVRGRPAGLLTKNLPTNNRRHVDSRGGENKNSLSLITSPHGQGIGEEGAHITWPQRHGWIVCRTRHGSFR